MAHGDAKSAPELQIGEISLKAPLCGYWLQLIITVAQLNRTMMVQLGRLVAFRYVLGADYCLLWRSRVTDTTGLDSITLPFALVILTDSA